METLIQLLKQHPTLSDWKITKKQTKSQELFFIRKTVDMNRIKDVTHTMLTVYVDFDKDGQSHRGSSSTEIHPTMSVEEMKRTIDEIAYAASFVKNQRYELVQQEEKALNYPAYENFDLVDYVMEVAQTVYAVDTQEGAFINSCEIFANLNHTTIINSKGVNATFTTLDSQVELIVNGLADDHEIELYRDFRFGELNKENLQRLVNEALETAHQRAIAKPTPALKKSTVLLSGGPVKAFLGYYLSQASAEAIHSHISTVKLNEAPQGSEIAGDAVTITLTPKLVGSSKSSPVDSDGIVLQEVNLYENGFLKTYWGDNRYCQYVNVNPTGRLENCIIQGGTTSLEQLRSTPHVELLEFSDFQMDTFTGDFAGEIRFGWSYDGQNRLPITGGSISGNIHDVHANMRLSNELQQLDNFLGPQAIELLNVSVTGIE